VKGRLAASGRLSEMLAAHVRGWDAVASGLTAEVVERARANGHVQRVHQLGSDRIGLEFPASLPPENVLAQIASWGGRIVSLNPLHDTLEDFFVRQVATTAADSGLDASGVPVESRRASVHRSGASR
jgi:hypothetical protein